MGVLKIGRFFDWWRGNGLHLSSAQWTFALRWRWHFRFVRPPGKPGYARLYCGPLEVEHRKTHNVKFSGVPTGHSSNHPAGGTSAGTQG